jgi:hypothetical protein
MCVEDVGLQNLDGDLQQCDDLRLVIFDELVRFGDKIGEPDMSFSYALSYSSKSSAIQEVFASSITIHHS